MVEKRSHRSTPISFSLSFEQVTDNEDGKRIKGRTVSTFAYVFHALTL